MFHVFSLLAAFVFPELNEATFSPEGTRVMDSFEMEKEIYRGGSSYET